MKVRPMSPADLAELKRIHEKHYSQEFGFPDFTDGFIGAFVVDNEEGQIVTAGGVRPIAETILITDKDFSIKERNLALVNALDVSKYLCHKHRFEQLHVFIQAEKYKNLLIKRVGFEPTKGQCLVLQL